MKNALITGITGQDGSFLAELLLKKGYNVFGLVRRKSELNYGNASHLIDKVTFIDGDLCDDASLVNAMKISNADEVYNLAAQSFVAASWTQPIFTGKVDALGVVGLLEAIRTIKPEARFYQASTSELYGLVQEVPQTELTPFYPRSPYAVAKLYGHWITVNYRESYNMYACSGILFNHESERRGQEFVTRKITKHAARAYHGETKPLRLGNLSAKRDWGHAEDYVQAMWLMLQQDTPDDYVIATGETHTVREFVQKAYAHAGFDIEWQGEGENEKGLCKKTKQEMIVVDKKFFRPAEVELLLGSPKKAETQLGWKRNVGFDELVARMVKHDIKLALQSDNA